MKDNFVCVPGTATFKGTKVYVGEVSSQGGIYVGGTQQIVVKQPWAIEGVEVLGRTQLK